MRRHPLFGLLLACFGALVLTPDALFMRLSGMGTAPMLAWRGLLMGLALMAAWIAFGRGDRRRDLLALCSGAGATVVAAQFFNSVLFSYGIATAPVPVVLFGVAAAPAFAAVIARALTGERTHWSTWSAIAAVALGIGVAVLGDGGESGGARFDADALRGALAGLGVAATLALIFATLRARPDVPILPAIGSGGILAGTAGLVVAGPAVFEGAVWAIAVSGAAILPVSFVSLSLAARHTHASNVSLLLLLETVLGPAWVWAVLGEAPTRAMLWGGAIVVLSLAAYLLYTRRRMAAGRRDAAA